MEPRPDEAQLQLHCVDSVQRRYEVIRPIVLIGDRTAAQRAEEPHLHPETIRDWTRRFRPHGMLGLFPEQTAIITPSRGKAVSDKGLEELARLKALSDGFGYREWARMLWHKTHEHMDDKTVKKLWQPRLPPVQGELPLPTYHSHPTRYQGRLEVVKLSYQGWTKRSICGCLQVSRPTVERWIGRFEAEHFAGLLGHKPGPQSPRKVWFPLMVDVYHLQKAPPDVGECRIWSLRGREAIAVRTGGRIMALKRQVYEDIPHQRRYEPQPPPQPPPYKATRPHQDWFIEGRMMDCALEGGRWWRLLLLEGDSRTLLAGAVAPSEASWVA